MTEAEQYLESIRELDARIRVCEQEMGRLRQDIISLKGTNYETPRVSGGSAADLSVKVVRLDCLDKAYQGLTRDWDLLINRREQARGLIHLMPAPELLRSVLLLYYINCWPAQRVQQELSISRASFYRYRTEALTRFTPFYELSKIPKSETS